MTLNADPSARRSPLQASQAAAAGIIALIALAGHAFDARSGPIDTNHRLERAGPGPASIVAILHRPGTSRLVMLQRGGDVLLVTGGGLSSSVVAHVPTEQTCGGHGCLGATWDPLAPGRALFVTYTDETTHAVAVGTVDLDSGAFTQVYRQPGSAACTNLGGGIAFASDGTIEIGVGDMGQPLRAASPVYLTGKILRMTRDGAIPAAPLALNPLAGSYVLAVGVRNPVRLTTDVASGDTWFLDLGNGDRDELNRVLSMGNYGWDTSAVMGYQDTSGREDPYKVWSPSETPSDITAYAGSNLGPYGGTLLVTTAGSGKLESVRPNLTNRHSPTVTVLFSRDATGPQSFKSLAILPDGFAYILDGAADIQRYVAFRGNPHEPSAIDSVVPVWARKAGAGNIEIGVERVRGAAEFGVYHGDLLTLTTAGYSHLAQAPVVQPVDTNVADAYSRGLIAESDLGPPGSSAYFLLSARRDCTETGLGSSSFAERPRPGTSCTGLAILGDGTHDISTLDVSVVLTGANGLDLPRDLEFHPDVPRQLWVVSRRNHSMLICDDPGLPTQTSVVRIGPNGQHFMAQPSALAFGPGTGFLATSHEEADYTQGPPPNGTPMDFMGPTLWLADEARFDAGDNAHVDMLHNSPNAMGIAWESGNAYWVYDGYHGSLTRYDFNQPHAPGGTDHSDGVTTRYAEGAMRFVPDIVSHVVYDPATGYVYAADTGNDRIAALDPSTGTNAGPTSPNYDGGSQTAVTGSRVWTLVNGADFGMVDPSGMEMQDGMLFVSDNATSDIYAFTLDGVLVDYLETGFPPGTLMGMAFSPEDGSLWVVDALTNRVLRIATR